MARGHSGGVGSSRSGLKNYMSIIVGRIYGEGVPGSSVSRDGVDDGVSRVNISGLRSFDREFNFGGEVKRDKIVTFQSSNRDRYYAI